MKSTDNKKAPSNLGGCGALVLLTKEYQHVKYNSYH